MKKIYNFSVIILLFFVEPVFGDPYKVLGIERSADLKEVKAAYKKKALMTHPDKTGRGDAEFKAVVAAYEELVESLKESEPITWQERDRIAREGQGRQARAAAQKAESDRLWREERERVARENQERQARAAAQRAKLDRLLREERERVARENQERQERAAAERAKLDRLWREERERIVRENQEAQAREYAQEEARRLELEEARRVQEARRRQREEDMRIQERNTLWRASIAAKGLVHIFDVNSCFSSFEEKSIQQESLFILENFNKLAACADNTLELESFIRKNMKGFSNGDILNQCIYLNIKQLLVLPVFMRHTRLVRNNGLGGFPIILEMLFDSAGLVALFNILDRRVSVFATVFTQNKDVIGRLVNDYKRASAAYGYDEIAIDFVKEDLAKILRPTYKPFRTEIEELFSQYTVGSKLTALMYKMAFTIAGVCVAEYVQKRGGIVQAHIRRALF
jgi:curved DNA-binding protein CbpA